MCGICGFAGAPLDADDVLVGRAMRDCLRHRGPDGEGEARLKGPNPGFEGWFGHRRLKVVDLTDAAKQPMASDDGFVVLNYNGEIYNFRELRARLNSAGHIFRSSGDTEVVLKAYEEWGLGFVEKLDGMFAIALWDGHVGQLVLARDRTGKKPLYYVVDGGRISFASEIKSLLALPWVRSEPDLRRIPELLTFGYVPCPRTMYQGIVQVPAASFVVYDADGVQKPQRYWDAIPASPRRGTQEYRGEVARLLEHATRRRMISDVPLGALLSGGIDSSIVVALMARASREPIRTFTIGFPDDPSFDERHYARLVARHLGTQHTELPVRIDAVSLVETLLWHHDQPYADSSAIPTYLVTRLAREYVTVALNGDGGDEIFGGYERFVAVALSEIVPAFLSGLASKSSHLLPLRGRLGHIRRSVGRFAEFADRPPRERYQGWISVMNEELLRDVLTGEAPDRADITRSMSEAYEGVADLPLLDQVLYANFKTYLPDDLAVKMDRMSMANSLETRSPFLDTALIEYVTRIPASDRVGLATLKPMLRRTFRHLLPEEIWNRRKHGFGVPMDQWFRSELGEMFRDEALVSNARIATVLDLAAVRRIWDEHRSGRVDHGPRLWTVLTLEHWLRTTERLATSQAPAAAIVSG